MSIICYRNGVIACDSQVTTYDSIVGYTKKIAVSGGRWAIGVVGKFSDTRNMVNRFENLMKHSDDFKQVEKLLDSKDSSAILIDNSIGCGKHQVYYKPYNSKIFVHIDLDKYIAIGSGQDVAMGAMHQGAEASEAVAAAISHDVYCSGDIHWHNLDTWSSGVV